MSEQPFYASGLRFSCARCSSCCRHESGFVYLSENDLSLLAREFEMDYTPFIQAWCRWVSFERGSERLALKEKSNFDCIFWNRGGGCKVYRVRPLQCRAFPFWDSVVCSGEAWENTGAGCASSRGCPGINSGELHARDEIENFLRLMENEPVIERRIPSIGGSNC
jgi:Fe-S-cluster containining protein